MTNEMKLGEPAQLSCPLIDGVIEWWPESKDAMEKIRRINSQLRYNADGYYLRCQYLEEENRKLEIDICELLNEKEALCQQVKKHQRRDLIHQFRKSLAICCSFFSHLIYRHRSKKSSLTSQEWPW